MYRSLLASMLLVSLTAVVHAQVEKFNPYAPVVDEPALREDGTLKWPTYFRANGMELKYQGYFQSGSCVGTGKRVNAILAANKVDINKLARMKLQAQAVGVGPGAMTAVDQDRKPVSLFIHPKGVSQIEVTGEITAAQVVPGMIVRFAGAVDKHAQGLAPLSELEVISSTPDLKPVQVMKEKEQTIVGKVEKHQRGQIVVNVGVGSLRNLTFTLPADARVEVNGKTLDLIGAGDTLEAEGPIYTGGSGERSVFAEKLIVRKLQRSAQAAN